MSGNLFIPLGATATIPINYSYAHADPGLVPPGVSVVSDQPEIASIAMADDGAAYAVKGASEGSAQVKTTAQGYTDTVDVTVGPPRLIGLATNAALATFEFPEPPKPAIGPKTAAPKP